MDNGDFPARMEHSGQQFAATFATTLIQGGADNAHRYRTV